MGASDDTWRIEMKCTFPGPIATRCCSCLTRSHDFLLCLSCALQAVPYWECAERKHMASIFLCFGGGGEEKHFYLFFDLF